MQLIKKLSLLLALLFGQCFFAISSLAADENPYNIADVAVSVAAKTPTDARNLAIKTARKDALLILLARLGVDLSVVNKISEAEVSEMVRSEQISDERIAGSNYSASFNIVFAKDFVDHILAQKNLKVVEKEEEVAQKSSYLVISAKSLKRKTLLWEESNDWKVALDKAFKSNGDKNFRSPSGDIDDVAVLNGDNLMQISYDDLEPLFSKYRVDMIYVTTFLYDSVANKASVAVRGFGRFRKTQSKLTFANTNGFDEAQLMEKVAEKTAEYLSGINSGKGSGGKSQENAVNLEIPVYKLGDWLMIKNKIERSGLITKMNIVSISRDYVNISVYYNNPTLDIVDAFASIGFSLTKKNEDGYVLILK